MLKKYLTKFMFDILPSVAATVIGAYIVNHYIVTKPAADVAAAVSARDPKAAAKTGTDANTTDAKTTDPKISNLPAAGVKAKGISEKAILEKTAAERPAVVEKAEGKPDVKSDVKPDVKAADVPAETASIAVEPRPARPAAREKVRVVLPSPVQAVAPATVPSSPPAAVHVIETALPDDRRDANDLARAAIERLRVNNDNVPRAVEIARTTEPQRSETSRIIPAPALRPLPPPITVSMPSAGDIPDHQGKPPYAPNASVDPHRPTPPADIPLSPFSRPLDLRADVAEPSLHAPTSVADDVLSAAKSVFHAVLPK